MSGQSIGSVIGAVIGFAVGGPIGGFVGSMIGGYVGGQFDPPVQGPRLQDLKAQSSEYGRPIPITYGTIALGGNVIWASDLVEVESDSSGKGGPTVANYTYYANFAVAICEGEVTLGRIWAGPEKRLIWDGSTLEGADSGAQLRFYSGSEDQMPDPLMESYLGAGNVPAHRGTAYVVLENFPVAKDGNRIPFLTIEVGAQSEAPQPLGYVWPISVWYSNNKLAMFHGPGTGGILVQGTDEGHTWYASDTLKVNSAAAPYATIWDPDREQFVFWSGPSLRFVVIPQSTATEDYYTLNSALRPALTSPFNGSLIYHLGKYIFSTYTVSSTLTRGSIIVVNPDTLETEAWYAYDGTASNTLEYMKAPADPSAAYVISANRETSEILKIPLASGAAPISLGTFANQSIYTTPVYGIASDTGYVYTLKPVSWWTTAFTYTVHDPITETKVLEVALTLAESFAGQGWFFVPNDIDGQPRMCCFGVVVGAGTQHWDYYLYFNSDGTFYREVKGASNGAAVLKAMAYDDDRKVITASRNDYGGAMIAESPVNGTPDMIPLKTWEMGVFLGSSAPRSAKLADVVSDLSQRAGLATGQIDVTQLADDTVDGYAIASQMDVRSAITALAPAYFFDGVESFNGTASVVKFVKRGGAIAAVIADDELGAYESGSQATDPLQTTRQMDEDLPANMNVNYLLAATKYDGASRLAKRLVGNSGDESTLDMPIVMTDTKAQEVAEVNLHLPWVERLKYQFSLPRKYAYLEPTDIVVVRGYTVRITSIKQTGGRYDCEAVHDDANVYLPNVVVTETPPPPGDVVETIAATTLELM